MDLRLAPAANFVQTERVESEELLPYVSLLRRLLSPTFTSPSSEQVVLKVRPRESSPLSLVALPQRLPTTFYDPEFVLVPRSP